MAGWLASCGPAAAQPAGSFDLALVLAIDCSGSVSGTEFRLQTHGIAAAFRDPEVIASALSGPNGRIAVNLLSWGDPDDQKFASGWFEINSPEAAETFARTAEAFDIRSGGGTGIAHAIAYGVTLIQTSGLTPSRKVIDVSGDGVESYELRQPHFFLPDAQRLRAAAGVIVNGLAIRTDFHDLDRYYREHVAGGSGSFVMEVANYQDLAEAMRIKLLREIRPLSASLAP